MGITESLGDTDFEQGQLADAEKLGDTGKSEANGFDPDWLPAFKNAIDGIILVGTSLFLFLLVVSFQGKVAGECQASVAEGISKVEHVLGTSISKVLKVEANVRPGKEKGHEHFVSYLSTFLDSDIMTHGREGL